jgi:hypothetical protein
VSCVPLAASVSRVPRPKPVACLYLAHSPPLPTNIFFFKFYTVVYIYIYISFFSNILPCISILSYKKNKINAAVYTCPVCSVRQACPWAHCTMPSLLIHAWLCPARTLPMPIAHALPYAILTSCSRFACPCPRLAPYGHLILRQRDAGNNLFL